MAYRPSADRMSQMKASSVRAGKGKGSKAVRQAQNYKVKHGTMRRGAKGKHWNVYNAKTGTWQRATMAGAGSDGVNAKSSAGTARSSGSPVTESVVAVKPNSRSGGDFENFFKTSHPGVAYPGPGAKSKGPKLPPSSVFKQGGGGLYGWLRGR